MAALAVVEGTVLPLAQETLHRQLPHKETTAVAVLMLSVAVVVVVLEKPVILMVLSTVVMALLQP